MSNSHKKNFLGNVFIYSVANYFSQALGIVTSIAMRTFLGPAAMGVWMLVQVLLDYSGQAALGTTRAMFRDYPRAKGAGNFEEAEDIKNTTFSFVMAMSVFPFACIAGYLFFFKSLIDPLFEYSLFFLLGFIFLQRFHDFLITLLRADKQFKVLSVVIAATALAGCFVVFFLVKHAHLKGMLWGSAVTLTLISLFVLFLMRYRIKFDINKKILIHELKLALPLAGAAFLATFLRGLDKIIIAKELGLYELGIYSIAMMVGNYIISFPMMFSHVWYPNLQEIYAKNNKNQQSIAGYFKKPILAFAVIVPLISGLVLIGMPILIHLFLGKFSEGVPVMKIYMLSFFFNILGVFSTNFLVTIDRYWMPIFILLVSIAINFIANSLFIYLGWGLPGVALGTSICFAFNGLISLLIVLKSIMQTRERVDMVIKSALLFLLLMLGVFKIDEIVKLSNLWTEAAFKMFLLMVFMAPFLFWLEKKLCVLRDLFGRYFPASKPRKV
ncbi:MAG TPA: oligosaccharide flippase family protein [Candidatus Omnitrophota bacterium]|nr:oligosaccharide flippase family protein [Candidatus Omnitrophota bacterium]